MAELAFGARVLVHATAHATVARYTRPGVAAWPGAPIPAEAGWGVPGDALDPPAGTGAVRLRRLPSDPPTVGIVIGVCVRYEGTYQPPEPSAYSDDGGGYESGALTYRREVRLYEVAMAPTVPGMRAALALVWHADCEAAP